MSTTEIIENLRDASKYLQLAYRLMPDEEHRKTLNEAFLRINEVKDFYYHQDTEDKIRIELDRHLVENSRKSISADDLVAIRSKLRLGTLDRVAEVYIEWEKERSHG